MKPSDATPLVDTDDAPDEDAAAPATRRGPSVRRRYVAAALLLVGSIGLATTLYLTQFRVDLATDSTAAATAVRAASDGAVAVLSYQPDTLDSDLAAAESHLTGEFATYYGTFVDEILLPAARERAVVTTASVTGAAEAELTSSTAKVLLFLNQVTTSRDRPEPAQSASSVMVSLTKVDDRWLISAFDPL